MLVDTGWPDFNGRDADRIASVAKTAGVTRIDYLVITHYHMDHVGGVPQLAERLPISTYVDHGRERRKRERGGRALIAPTCRSGIGPPT